MDTFEYFKQICRIPRESGNEEGMRQYLLSWAKENGFKSVRDKSGNIIIYADATPGYENVPTVALQGHMDMVCVKTAESKHDFLKDPIEVYQDGDRLRAKDTSLGADNGIAVAMTLALLTDPSVKHGKLEAIFTYCEETGMDGAFGLDASLVSARKLINIDSEEEGIIFIGCAGGVDFKAERKVGYENCPEGYEALKVKIGGLLGGHSGGEIHHQRANAVSVLVRMLYSAKKTGIDLRLTAFDGGTRRNVIPSTAECTVAVPSDRKSEVLNLILAEFEKIKEEYRYQDPGLYEEHKCSKCDTTVCLPEKVLSSDDTGKIIDALYACPHGVCSQSFAIPGIVETSDNLAICKLEKDTFTTEVSVRSLILSARDSLAQRINLIFSSFGFDTWLGNGYPSWAPNPDSELANLCAEVWKEQTGKEAVLTSVHAGLECGVINSRIPGMDSVSIGPEMKDIHSVNENLSVSSTKVLYEFLKKVLSKVK